MIEEKKSACITTYTRAKQKHFDFNTKDIPLLIVSIVGAGLSYGLWAVASIAGVWPW